MDEHAARRRLEGERLRLQAAWDLLHEAVAGTQQEHTGELSGFDEHLADTATDTLDREVDLSLIHDVEHELRAIAAAEARIAAGTYGRCETCGGPIGDERLAAVPWATRCLADQVHAETLDGSLRADVLHGPNEGEAIRHSDLIPDDEASEDVEPSAEEGAMHVEA